MHTSNMLTGRNQAKTHQYKILQLICCGPLRIAVIQLAQYCQHSVSFSPGIDFVWGKWP